MNQDQSEDESVETFQQKTAQTTERVVELAVTEEITPEEFELPDRAKKRFKQLITFEQEAIVKIALYLSVIDKSDEVIEKHIKKAKETIEITKNFLGKMGDFDHFEEIHLRIAVQAVPTAICIAEIEDTSELEAKHLKMATLLHVEKQRLQVEMETVDNWKILFQTIMILAGLWVSYWGVIILEDLVDTFIAPIMLVLGLVVIFGIYIGLNKLKRKLSKLYVY